jgi:DNA-binding beta-propeller fold protein YncE
MTRPHLLALALASCATHSGGGGVDGGAPPFTKGVSTLAGAADPGVVDGSRDVARFANPVNVAVGPDGNLFVADHDNGKIRVVASDGTTSTLIAQMAFRRPFGMTFASSGAMFVTTDSDQNGAHAPGKTGSIWRVDVHAKQATILANAIGMPRGIVALADGRLAVTDYENHVVELVDASTGRVTILAGALGAAGYVDGAGAAARFNIPYGIVQRGDGKLVIADAGNNRLRIVALDGTTTTLAGTGTSGFVDGAMGSAQFAHPQGLAQTQTGDLIVTDLGNYRVRRIGASAVDTIAGDGTGGYIDADDRLASELFGLEGVATKPDGSMVYVADGTRGEAVPFNRVRQIDMVSSP